MRRKTLVGTAASRILAKLFTTPILKNISDCTDHPEQALTPMLGNSSSRLESIELTTASDYLYQIEGAIKVRELSSQMSCYQDKE